MLRNYLKVALKVLRRRPLFTLVSLFGIAFTLTVLTVATALLDNVFGGFPPETKLDRTVGIFYAELHGPTMHRSGGDSRSRPLSAWASRRVRTISRRSSRAASSSAWLSPAPLFTIRVSWFAMNLPVLWTAKVVAWSWS